MKSETSIAARLDSDPEGLYPIDYWIGFTADMCRTISKISVDKHDMLSKLMVVLHPDIVEGLTTCYNKDIARAARAHQGLIGG